MAMGTRKQGESQEEMWVARAALPTSPGHPFYERLQQLLDENQLDAYVEGRCQRFYAEKMGRPSLAPGVYFRLLLIGYFEGCRWRRKGGPFRRLKGGQQSGCAVGSDVTSTVV
jgi:transposase